MPTLAQQSRHVLNLPNQCNILMTQVGPLLIGPMLWYLGDAGARDESGLVHYDRVGYIAILAVGYVVTPSCCLVTIFSNEGLLGSP